MRIRGSLSKGLLIALALSMIPEAAVSAQKITPGSACKTLNQKVVYLNKTYTCTKSGKKLIWNKGVAVKKPTPENLSLSDPVLNCKIKDASNPEVGQYGGALYGGFIEKDRPIPSSGTVTWYLIPLDFSDLKGESNWRTRVDQQIQLLTEYYETVSYGKLKIQWKVYDNWITLPGTQLKYAINQSGDYIATENFWKDAISVVDPKVDFTGVQVVNFLLPRDQSDFKESAQGFPWTGDINKYNASEGKLSAFTLLGKFFEASQRTYWSYWAHEYGHTLGIPHIGGSRSTSTFQTYDLMGNQDSRRELSGWSRFAVTKWIEDEWVFCKDKANIKSEIVNLTKLNSKEAGHKIIVIPLSPTKSLIVESRMTNKFSGIDLIKGRTDGVFVYTYDATLGHNEDYFTQASLETDPILIRGESVTYDGVTIKVLSVGSQDKILITKQ
jgi:M6 family metalloprotease-like protein